ncbi:MAG: sensor histidine kinase [Tissierellales bacterium]|nr:sensor histidine kinase [Tissierellales bacterium]
MGNNAMDMAVTVASIPLVQDALSSGMDNGDVQRYIESFRKKTRFQYIIVMDMQGIQYSYPYAAGVGKYYINGGEEKVLSEGQAYTSADRNVLISAIRAFAPIYSEDRQVGAVLVGLLTDRITKENEFNRNRLEFWLSLSLIAGIMVSIGLSINIKKSIYGLEPKEIAVMLSQRDLILESIHRGIIAVDQHGKILLSNDPAERLFNLPEETQGHFLSDYNEKFWLELQRIMESGQSSTNKTLNINPVQRIVMSTGVMKDPTGAITGVVASFEDLTEAKELAEKITGYRNMVCALRAQNHEFMNRLHTISGLVQLEEYNEAIAYIDHLSEVQTSFSGLLKEKIRNPHLSAILLAKYSRLTEAKIQLIIDEESDLEMIPVGVTEDEVCSIVGNFIDNSQEALVGTENPVVKVLVASTAEGLIIEVSDNGPGIPEHVMASIFKQGVSTKGENRGMGLFIIKNIVDAVAGDIELIEDGMTTWHVYLPNNKVGDRDD